MCVVHTCSLCTTFNSVLDNVEMLGTIISARSCNLAPSLWQSLFPSQCSSTLVDSDSCCNSRLQSCHLAVNTTFTQIGTNSDKTAGIVCAGSECLTTFTIQCFQECILQFYLYCVNVLTLVYISHQSSIAMSKPDSGLCRQTAGTGLLVRL